MEKAKLRHDRHIAGRNFEKGDKVWLVIKARKKGITSSIAHKYDGTYTVLGVMNNGANNLIKHDGKRSRAKTVNRNQLRICRTRMNTSKDKDNKVITVNDDESKTTNNTIKPKSVKRKLVNTKNDDNIAQTVAKQRGRPRKVIEQTNKETKTNDAAQTSSNNTLRTGYNLRRRKTSVKVS